MYLIAQNFFTSQIFLKFNMTFIILIIAVVTFLLLHFIVFVIYKYARKSSVVCRLQEQYTVYLLIAYLCLFVIGIIGFNGSGVIKAFVYRYCLFEKITLRWPVMFNKGGNLHTIPPQIDSTKSGSKYSIPTETLKKQPNIILIVLDALRYDIFTELLEDKQSFVHNLPDEYYIFTNSYSHSTYTVASISSLFSSKYFAARSDLNYPTLAEILSRNGYYTYSLNNFKKYYDFDSVIIKGKKYPSLLTKGFIKNEKTEETAYKAVKDYEITTRFSEFLKSYDHKKPLFAYIHCSELHFIPPTAVFKNLLSNANFLNTYRDFLKTDDDNLRLMVKVLKRNNMYNNSIVIVTSDHGESANEHEQMFHVFSLYQENVKIPLLVKFPEQAKGGFINTHVSALDMVPTLLDYLNYKSAGIAFDGKSYLSYIENRLQKDMPVFMSVYMYDDPKTFHYSLYGTEGNFNKTILEAAVIDDKNWKLIYNLFYGFNELYNLTDDPEESNNLIDDRPEVAARLLQKLHNTLFLKK
jgi:hypothetical protein